MALALCLGHCAPVHQHGESIFLQLGHGPEAPAQRLRVFLRRCGADVHAVGPPVVTRQVQGASHALPENHTAFRPLIDQHGDVPVGVERKKVRRVRGASLVAQRHMGKVEPKLGSRPERAHGAGSSNAVNGERHGWGFQTIMRQQGECTRRPARPRSGGVPRVHGPRAWQIG